MTQTSGIKGYQYKIDTGAWSPLSLDLTHEFAGLTDGAHTVSVKAYDNANNSEIALFHCTVDTVVPTLAISHPTDGWFTRSTSVTAFWNGSDATSGILGFAYSLDGASWTSNGMGLSRGFSGLTEGNHTVSVMVTDYAMNSHIVSVNFTLDLTAPSLEISSSPEGYYLDQSTVPVQWSATDGSSGMLGYIYRIDQGEWSSMDGTVSLTYVGLDEGTAHLRGGGIGQRAEHRPCVGHLVHGRYGAPSLYDQVADIGEIFNYDTIHVVAPGRDDVTSWYRRIPVPHR